MWLALLKNKNKLWLIFFMLALSACTCKPLEKAKPAPLRLFLASSLLPLQKSIESLVPEGSSIDMQFLSSSLIAQQVSHGALCDGLILADREWLFYVQKKLSLEEPARVFANNSLTLATRDFEESKSAEHILAHISGKNQLIIADPSLVPLGRYSEQALKRLGLWEKLQPSLVYAHSAHNARVLFENKAAPYALLFNSENIKNKNIINTKYHKPVEYLYVKCPQTPHALMLENILFSPELKALLSQHNFIVPDEL